MSYHTKFRGQLKFKKELTMPELSTLRPMLGADVRKNQEWRSLSEAGCYYIDLALAPDFTGLVHNEADSTYGLEKATNLVLQEMRRVSPDFGLTGELEAWGEEFGDHWFLRINAEGNAYVQKA